ncbi:MAG: hypothetical protein K6G32_10145 [Prevotella sp.]|nr:hypothetical protein [Prevotella sp.]
MQRYEIIWKVVSFITEKWRKVLSNGVMEEGRGVREEGRRKRGEGRGKKVRGKREFSAGEEGV